MATKMENSKISATGLTPKKRRLPKSSALTPSSTSSARKRYARSRRTTTPRKMRMSATKSASKIKVGLPFTPFSDSKKRRKFCSPFCPDRFISTSTSSNPDLQEFQFNSAPLLPRDDEKNCPASASLQFQDTLAKELFNGDGLKSKILAFKQKPKAPKGTENFHNKLRVLYSANRESRRVRKAARYISAHPERILDAPELLDDYYVNILDWSSENVLAVGLGPTVYLWNARTGEINQLMESEDEENLITSLRWVADGSHLAIGSGDKNVQIWNVENQRLIRSMQGHDARIAALSWNNHVLSSGGRDSLVIHHDVRISQNVISSHSSHTQEVCGLTWSPDGTQLASGGNDNKCFIWEFGHQNPRMEFTEHKAAVRALAWSPFQRNLLATGAGTADRCIRFFNTTTGTLIKSTETDSQVCSLQWSRSSRELVSAHGYSQNQISVWNYSNMSKIIDLKGHSSRVLHTSLSPDGTTLCSAGADETLRFWKIFNRQEKAKKTQSEASFKRGHWTRKIR
mmetsp:Transcript_9223/g.14914  ORF Transcript_9223/g.14914 Transcript_9223/m.14914 type:complete len:513 (+) Transcript_9223:168-1706(+)